MSCLLQGFVSKALRNTETSWRLCFWINWAKVELYFPKFPSLYDCELGLAIRKIYRRCRRWKCSSSRYPLLLVCWPTHQACTPASPPRHHPSDSPSPGPSVRAAGREQRQLCCRPSMLSRLMAPRNRSGFQFTPWVSLSFPSATSQWRFFPTSALICTQAQWETQRPQGSSTASTTKEGHAEVQSFSFCTSGSASVTKTYAIYVILSGTALVQDVEGTDWTLVRTRGVWELSVASFPLFCGPKTSLKN